MLFQKKLKLLIKDYFDCDALYSNNTLTFNYKDKKVSISGFIKYKVSINDSIKWEGFQIDGFLFALKEFYKSNEIQIIDPLQEIVNNLVTIPELNKLTDTSAKDSEIQKLKKTVIKLSKNHDNLVIANNSLAKKSQEIKQYKDRISELENDCKEAANLIETLYYDKEELIKGTKRYKLDHFSKDVQEFINDLINEYYNK